jgi:hypothetical protein
MAAYTPKNAPGMPNFGDNDTPNSETFEDLLRSVIDLVNEQRTKRAQVMCCIYKLTQANVIIPISVKEIVKATNLLEREVLGIVIYLKEQRSFVECPGDLDLDASFYISSKGITELEFDIDEILKKG